MHPRARMSTGPSDSDPPTPSAGVTSADLAFCVSETNRYRAMAGAASVARSSVLETYAATAIQADALSGNLHNYTRTHPPGVAFGENGFLRLPLNVLGSIQGVLREALLSFWNSSSHRATLTGGYTQVGCGVFVQGNDVSVLQHFR